MRSFFSLILFQILFLQVSVFADTSPNASIGLPQFQEKPKLILVLVVDQFRADYLTRFQSRFLPAHLPGEGKQGKQGKLASKLASKLGGYQYLMSQGAYFPFARYDVLQCMTGPGHAMILTGAYPYLMGIPTNIWYDHSTKKPVYCVEDSTQQIVGGNAGANKGVSPKNLGSTTVGDELKNAGYPSRVVGVALKDRAAILLGGHRADMAFWFQPESFNWVSSRYYMKDSVLPGWVQTLNKELNGKKGQPYAWAPSGKPTGLTLGVSGGVSAGFKYDTVVGQKEILNYPYGLELTGQMAKLAFDELKLGKNSAPDLLAVSFSSHDYLGHLYGPNTLEMEEMTVSEDRVISDLLNHINKKMIERNPDSGIKDVLVVLTADHGIPPSPSWLSTVGVSAGQIDADRVSQKIDSKLNEIFGKPANGKWVEFVKDLNVYLSRSAIAEKKVSLRDIEERTKEELRSVDGVAFVFSGSDYADHKLPPAMFERQIGKSYVPGKSGDVIAIPRPFFMQQDDPVSHMTSYNYDATVPLIMSWAGAHKVSRIRHGVYYSHADVVDLAPTLSFILGIVAPPAAEGRVLDIF